MGAMGVDKGTDALRFICIPTSINEYFTRPQTFTHTLPYPAQLASITLAADQVLIGDSTDLASAFNLFVLPPIWRQFFAFHLPVQGHAIGVPHSANVFIAMNVIPMAGWDRLTSCRLSSTMCSSTSRSSTQNKMCHCRLRFLKRKLGY